MTAPHDLMMRLELMALQDRYVSILDNDQLEDWPSLFVDDCLYEIMPRENEDQGLPIPVVHCASIKMIRDRVMALRHANIFEKPSYRHFVSGLQWQRVTDNIVTMQSSYLVVNTTPEGETGIYQAGRYLDRVVHTQDGWRFQQKRCIYDTLRIQTLLAVPI